MKLFMLIMNPSTKPLKQAYHLSRGRFNEILERFVSQNPAFIIAIV